MDTCEEDACYLFYVKVALANVIIKNKPPNTTAKEYTEKLMKMLKDKDEQCDNKIKDLTAELFHAKQDILKAKIGTQLDTGKHSTRFQKLQSEDEIDSTLLTPPPSSDSNKNEKCNVDTLQRHAEFLRHVSFFCQSKSVPVFDEDSAIVVKETLHIIIQLLSQGETLLSLPERILQACVNGIIDTVSISKHHREIKDQVLSLVEHFINEMICCKQTQYCQNISRLLLPLGCSPELRDDVLCCLMSCVVRFSNKLQDVINGHIILHSIVHEYDNIYLVIWTIEQILLNTLHKAACPHNVREQLNVLMERSVAHISRSYPVFASCVWRLQALLIQSVKH